MDSRVTALIEDMQAGRISHPDGSIDAEALAARINALHDQVEDEESRVELIRLHDALMSVGERRIVEQGGDAGPFREAWRREHLSFILRESLTADGQVDEAKLARVNAREIAAGRLAPDETVHVRKVEPAPATSAADAGGSGGPGGLKGLVQRVSGLFGRPAPQEPEPAPARPAAENAAEPAKPSELERAYRALFRWEDERMRPRIEALVEDFRRRLQQIEPEEGQSFRSAAEQETLEIARWFEENQEGFVGEAVSYLDDDVLQGLQDLGVDGQFGALIWEAIDEARADLAGRMHELREAAISERGGA